MNISAHLTLKTLLALLAFGAVSTPALAVDEVNVYSARKEKLIKPLLDQFTKETGIKVNLLTGKADGLLQRIKIEGRSSPADVFITVDAGRLYRAKTADILQPLQNEVLTQAIPENLRDPANMWFSLSQRARPIFYAKDRINPNDITRYEDLADPQWKKQLCLRSSDAVYNQSLTASKLAVDGAEKTEAWIKGMIANLARPPAGGDIEQLRFVAHGECNLTIVNTYYFGRLMASEDEKTRKLTDNIGIIWPNQQDRGTHVNVSGIGLLKTARHKDNAIKLMEFLVKPSSQTWYAEVNNEYPVVPGIPAAERLQKWGSYRADNINLQLLGEYNQQAVKLMDRGGWK